MRQKTDQQIANDRRRSREWARANRDKRRMSCTKYREKSQDKIREYNRKYYQAHKAQFLYHMTARKKRVRQATPPWADRAAIRDFYHRCPAGHHVDHIIPLRGKDVCGLHVLGNLQYLPAEENWRKNNTWINPDLLGDSLPDSGQMLLPGCREGS